MLTGARQTGKTTLVKRRYSELRYVNLDDPDLRESLASLRATSWGNTVGDAVLDEAQKAPVVFDKVKYAFDEGAIDFSVLLGSSRVLLMDRVHESLAGRAFIYDLWPLMASELAAGTGALRPPLVDELLLGTRPVREVLGAAPEVLLGDEEEIRRAALEHLARWGGMPALLHLEDGDRHEWLRSYSRAFLERDLADMARLHDLGPFRRLQRLVTLRSGSLLSYSELARDAQLSVNTCRRYLGYLERSYQIVLLPPFSRNLTSQTVKTPKVYWIDIGLLREGTGQRGGLTGEQFEGLVVTELFKWISTMSRGIEPCFYRTRSGLEVDLLLRTPRGLLGMEIRHRGTVYDKDTKRLRHLADAAGDEWSGGVVVYDGARVHPLDDRGTIWAVPAHRLLT